ncbi:hypothetical protein PAGU2196_17500 [Pseudomonas sp. PAGU 2196]|nr:hypothetical protein PAGU2196_17500 [Pseudomonas sp. PAGU 2196]
MKAFTLATLMTLATSPVFAFNLSDAANALSGMQNQKQQGQVHRPERHQLLLEPSLMHVLLVVLSCV